MALSYACDAVRSRRRLAFDRCANGWQIFTQLRDLGVARAQNPLLNGERALEELRRFSITALIFAERRKSDERLYQVRVIDTQCPLLNREGALKERLRVA